MSAKTTIEWTETTWNPVTGCKKVSSGCKNCYAERMARRLQAMGQPRYRNGFEVTLQPQALLEPLRWKRPRLIFVNSMSDLFHQEVPLEFIQKVFSVMNRCSQHQFQILTKHSNRLKKLGTQLKWTNNIWIGVSVESQKYTARVDDLCCVPATLRFLSMEPLLGPIKELNLSGVSWVIVGGESGPKARPMEEAWVKLIRTICIDQNVPFFFKQWGGVRKKQNGRLLDGREWNELPKYELT
ncbi:MAG: phage Gp37/Gp68 family protein [Bacteroidota bacterium]|nr:phage Gp37/Gp68 family protein [Bacteroidota bacterium]